jgi:hypothetical protein
MLPKSLAAIHVGSRCCYPKLVALHIDPGATSERENSDVGVDGGSDWEWECQERCRPLHLDIGSPESWSYFVSDASTNIYETESVLGAVAPAQSATTSLPPSSIAGTMVSNIIFLFLCGLLSAILAQSVRRSLGAKSFGNATRSSILRDLRLGPEYSGWIASIRCSLFRSQPSKFNDKESPESESIEKAIAQDAAEVHRHWRVPAATRQPLIHLQTSESVETRTKGILTKVSEIARSQEGGPTLRAPTRDFDSWPVPMPNLTMHGILSRML